DVKANAWDAYHQAGNQQDFQARFDKLQIPQETKASLWDMKWGAGQTTAPALPPPFPNPETLPGGKYALAGQPLPVAAPAKADAQQPAMRQKVNEALAPKQSGLPTFLQKLVGH